MSKHRKFILTPITIELEKGINATSIIEPNLEAFPLADYMFQSLFLRMTGFQEQKLKCINWELATEDYDYRRSLLKNEDKFAEYSRIEDKQAVYRNLLKCIQKESYDDFNAEDYLNKKSICTSAKDEIVKMFAKTPFKFWSERKYNFLKSNNSLIREEHFCVNGGLLNEPLISLYNDLYNTRNRLAHNVMSYQDNMPTLKLLANNNEGSNNFFIYFALLNLIDKVFTEVYKLYSHIIDSRHYEQ